MSKAKEAEKEEEEKEEEEKEDNNYLYTQLGKGTHFPIFCLLLFRVENQTRRGRCLMDPHGNFSISPLLRFSASPLLRHTPSPEALAPAYGIWLQLPGPGFSPWALAPTPRPWLQPLGLGSSPQASRAKKWRKFVVKCPKRERRKEEI